MLVMKKLIKLIVVLSTLLSSIIIYARAYDDDSGIEKQKIYPVYEDVMLVPSVKVDYAKPRIVVKATYPRLTSERINIRVETFNDLVNGLIKAELASFKKAVQENQPLQSHLPKKKIRNDLTIDFVTAVVNTQDKPLVSIRFNIQGYITGMPHPYHYHRVLNFDLDNGEQIELDDLFKEDSNYLEFIAEYSRDALERKLKDRMMVSRGTYPTPENYRNWNINPNGLLITFDEYQVAPYVFGTQTVLIPYSQLIDLIETDSPIANCLKKKKRCLRNNLLTGGFMDDGVKI